MNEEKKLTYKQAGVDIEAGNEAVSLIKNLAGRTDRSGTIGEIGGFSSLFALEPGKYREPVLVSATDGVGTKLKIAQVLGVHNTIGIDLVAMVVNDLVVTGAEPLFFLDYLAVGKVIPKKIASIVDGIAEGCIIAGAALIGGETAEHPGVMPDQDYDLAGFAVGVVEREKLVNGAGIKEGDVILALASSGLHSNGYSLVRRLFGIEDVDKLNQPISKLNATLGEELLRPTRIYVKSILRLQKLGLIRGAAHITGGGLTENIPRMLPDGLEAVLEPGSWQIPPIFEILKQRGQIDDDEMRRTFNLGIGMIVAVGAAEADTATGLLEEEGETVFRCGRVERGDGGVRFG